MTSAYPKTMDELIAQAQLLSRELGTLPSQNKLKAALHVRAERAKAVLNALKESRFDPTALSAPSMLPDHRPADAEPGAPELVSGTLPLDAVAAGPELVPDYDSAPVPPLVAAPAEAVPARSLGTRRPVHRWPVFLLAVPAFVAIWSGWVGVGALTGFGPVHPLPGIANGFTINSAITLPIGVETYAAYALRVWLAGAGPARAQRFAKRSAIAAFVLGGLGQIAYHLMTAAHVTEAPWPITTAVSCLPVVVLGFGAALGHLQNDDGTEGER
ncbi:MAG TPA: ABC transporter permease [Pseudonocardiaceae bacterium]|nr:ABC transporter permease [Pseudonocardiaceae bacterium]